MSSRSEDGMPELEESSAERPVPIAVAPESSPAAAEPNSSCGDEEEDDDDEDGWEELEEEDGAATTMLARCLFCTLQLPVSEILGHMKTEHGLDVAALVAGHALDCFGYIRLVNYVRTSGVSPEELRQLPAASWDDDAYMKPVIDCDPLLMIDVEDLASSPIASPADSPPQEARHVVNYEGDYVTLSAAHYEQLQRQLAELRRQLQDGEQRSEHLLKDMATMRGTMHQILRLDQEEEQRPPAAASAAGPAGDSNSYFESYAHYGIHHEMLSDRVRTEAYRDAIARNAAAVVRGRRVLDLGCGTGILSMMCARAGAAQVVGVDMSDVIYTAMDIVRENGLQDSVHLVKGRLEDVTLPGGSDAKFDIIVSEWMGYFLLFEGMLDSVLHARDRLLAPGGRLLPDRCTLSLCAISDPARYDRLIGFWSDVYGFKMTCLRGEVLKEASVEVVPAEAVCSDRCQIKDFDINTITVADTEFTAPFSLTVERSGPVTAIAGYFDTLFQLPQPVQFSTGPHVTPTHWKQTVFYLRQPLQAQTGETIDGTLFCGRDRKDVRGLRVTITIRGESQSYRVA